jgi:hypothetical protein
VTSHHLTSNSTACLRPPETNHSQAKGGDIAVSHKRPRPPPQKNNCHRQEQKDVHQVLDLMHQTEWTMPELNRRPFTNVFLTTSSFQMMQKQRCEAKIIPLDQ